jgi:hypothetical protein
MNEWARMWKEMVVTIEDGEFPKWARNYNLFKSTHLPGVSDLLLFCLNRKQQGIHSKEWTKSVADPCGVVHASGYSFVFPVFARLTKRRKEQG